LPHSRNLHQEPRPLHRKAAFIFFAAILTLYSISAPKKKHPNPRKVAETKQQAITPVVAVAAKPIPPRKQKIKKGPKRLKKRAPATVEDLDAEMEDYRAKATGSEA
jgi:hypothetical protein